ncbi:hypothetical protein GQ53DRAFT_742176 [Thozetella sp. PMI_491]|nr:hypothetical protein GQ53DRAFT_742176 [Thozetella sp. PMI_491]
MPPKRKVLAEADANAATATTTRAKKVRISEVIAGDDSKQGSDEASQVPAAPEPNAEEKGGRLSPGYHPAVTRSKRWSKVSNSANIDMNYRDATKDPEEAYAYICMCRAPRFATKANDDRGAEDAAGKPAEKSPAETDRPPCDFGETCICKQPASQHLGHEWILSYAGYYRFGCQRCHAETRSPENFHMHTFNGHESYGAMEVVQNLFLDFDEARRAKNCSEQWAIVEATAMFLLSDWGGCIATVDDGEKLKATAAQVARMVLATFATLEQAGLLKPDSEVRNVGLVMAMYLKLAYLLRRQSALEPSKLSWAPTTAAGAPKAKASKKSFDFHPARFASYVLTYSTKHAIPLRGVEAMDVYTRALDAYITLPKAAADPWAWAEALAAYKRTCALPVQQLGAGAAGAAAAKGGAIGGDAFDVTTWTSEQRARHSWKGKDALGQRELDAIRDGFVLDINHR